MTPNLIPRLGQPEDIASAAVYLASDEASWITGLNLADGGSYASGGAGLARPEDIAAYAPGMAEMSEVDHWASSGRRVQSGDTPLRQ
ncbi:SDR family oxidoreductase [Rhodococcus jostii]|nr:SDR family oxidoreductase [Rhodococcus jostii]